MGPSLTELFPSGVGGGQGFAYNFGRGIGALFPTLVGYLSATMPHRKAIGILAASAYLLVLLRRSCCLRQRLESLGASRCALLTCGSSSGSGPMPVRRRRLCSSK